MKNRSVCVGFFAIGVADAVLERNEFYKQDIDLLRDLGFEVKIVRSPGANLSGIDVAFVWWWTWLWLLGPRLRRLGIPIIATGTLDPVEYDKRPIHEKILLRLGCRFPARNVFVSRFILDGLTARFRVPNAEICPHIVTDDYALDPGVERDPRVIFNVAWKKRENMARKMQPELIEAFAIARSRMPELRLKLAGAAMDGEVLLRERCAQLGITKYVEFLGPISKVRKLLEMRSCGMYFQCSRSEGFGVAIAEAMACGAAVVVNRATAIPEVVGECGEYVKDTTPRSISDTFVELASNTCLARTLGEAASRRIDTCFRLPVRREYFRRLITSVTTTTRH